MRYEDNQTFPDVRIRISCKADVKLLIICQRPFGIGFTLAGFTAISTNEKWVPAFIESTAGSIHKVCRLGLL